MPGHGKMCHCPLARSSTTQRQFPHRPPQYMPISVIARLCVRLKKTVVKLCIPAAPLNSSGVGGRLHDVVRRRHVT
jgi:hypothetical protein